MDLAIKLLFTNREFERETGLTFMAGPSRYFLIRFLIQYESQSVTATVVGFAQEFGMTDRAVSRALREFVQIGALAEEVAESQGGRPARRFQVTEGFRSSLARADLEPDRIRFRSLARFLLTAPFDSNGGKRKSRLTPRNRLLLAALFARADPGGVVRGAGLGELRRICELSADQLTSQMSKFAEAGYLRARVGGVSGQYLFGKSTGFIFLNPDHGDFGPHRTPQWLILRRDWGTVVPENEGLPAKLLFQRGRLILQKIRKASGKSGHQERRHPSLPSGEQTARQKASMFQNEWSINRYPIQWPADSGAQPDDEDPTLAHFFADWPPWPYIELLQAHIDDCAVWMLTRGLSETNFPESDLRELIAHLREVLSAPRNPYSPEPVVSAVLAAALAQVRRANEAVKSLKEAGELGEGDLSGACYALLPARPDSDELLPLSLVIIPENPASHSTICWDLLMTFEGTWKAHSITPRADESFLEFDQRKKLGLQA